MTVPAAADLQRVRLLLEATRFGEAASALASVIAAAPDDPEPRCLLAQAYLGMRQPGDAATAAQRALALEPTSTWARRLLALSLHNSGNHTGAVLEARQLVAADPDEWRSWWVLSISARGFGGQGAKEAIHAAHRAVALAPEQGDVHDAYGSALLAGHDVDGAEEAFRRALALDPTDAYAHNGLGQVALQRKDPAAAANGFRRALLADPREAAARHNLRIALQQALRPLAFVVAVCAFLLRLVTDAHPHEEVLVRASAAAAALVATGALAWSVHNVTGRLDPTLRRFYVGLVRDDRRLAGGIGLHLLAVLTLYLVVVLPLSADSAVWVVAFVAVLAGRVLLFRTRR